MLILGVCDKDGYRSEVFSLSIRVLPKCTHKKQFPAERYHDYHDSLAKLFFHVLFVVQYLTVRGCCEQQQQRQIAVGSTSNVNHVQPSTVQMSTAGTSRHNGYTTCASRPSPHGEVAPSAIGLTTIRLICSFGTVREQFTLMLGCRTLGLSVESS